MMTEPIYRYAFNISHGILSSFDPKKVERLATMLGCLSAESVTTGAFFRESTFIVRGTTHRLDLFKRAVLSHYPDLAPTSTEPDQ
jgi:hypothetical protein